MVRKNSRTHEPMAAMLQPRFTEATRTRDVERFLGDGPGLTMRKSLSKF